MCSQRNSEDGQDSTHYLWGGKRNQSLLFTEESFQNSHRFPPLLVLASVLWCLLQERHFARAHFKKSPWISPSYNSSRSTVKTQASPHHRSQTPSATLSRSTTSHPTPRLTAPGTRRLQCIFNSATLKWHSGKCTQSIINEIISLYY